MEGKLLADFAANLIIHNKISARSLENGNLQQNPQLLLANKIRRKNPLLIHSFLVVGENNEILIS